ncbi:LOW QUALITY PROTEIN: origin recognition complex subunit 2-like [Lasioglossum baleicum]|uniref:LOW QUALITY PROTEIN: origin recognition complex subunit 2-like n=1 Tax=Lasioglossum baleicum TaxID=434251 RepID=UPI003FCC47CC
MSAAENLRRSSRIQARVEVRGTTTYNSDEDQDTFAEASVALRKELNDIEETVQKPVELFSSNDVSGQTLYKFQTPSKKNAMTQKASLCRTPVSSMRNLVPKVVLERIELNGADYPKDVQKMLKYKQSVSQDRRRFKSGLTSSESESVSEPSDYMPSDEESSDESSESNYESNNEEEEDNIKLKAMKHKIVIPSNLLSTPKKTSNWNKPAIVHKDFHMKTDEYFESQTGKAVTSNRTLEHLHNSRLTKEKLEELLANQNYVSTRHKKNICSLTESYTTLIPMWYFIMEQGYNVLLYGLGSKRCLINNFHKSVCYHPSLVVNGFFPSLTVKDILDGIIVDLLELSCPVDTTACIDIIEKAFKEDPKDRLYLLIHNIDGIMLRSNKAQDLLSRLASIPNVCVLASVDHVNAPLLWDHIKRSRFNFFWWDTSTLLSYQEETSYESSLLVQQSGALALSSLQNVFLSLTSNAKSIYILLAKYQLSNSGTATFAGMAFKDLYRAAREGFLVSSDLALRAQLTEFIDHKLVKVKRNIDSVEHLVIPLSNTLLKQFLEEHEP